jgi:hypothetical protein
MTNDKQINLFTWTCRNQTTSWSIFYAWTSHEQTQTHKIHHDLDLGEATTFPLIVFSMFGHKASTQMSFCPGIHMLGVMKLGLPQLWRPITFCTNLSLRWGPKKSCNHCRKFSNSKWQGHLHASKSRWFVTFSGRKSNWQFDSWPFFWP